MVEQDRRLDERILHALELALEQGELDIAESLHSALVLSLTRFGGPGAVEKREIPAGLDLAFERLELLRHGGRAA